MTTQTSGGAVRQQATTSAKICYIIAPDGQAGGGMGRVKDYILQSGGDRYGRFRVEALVTRDQRGFVASLRLTLRAVAKIWVAHLQGRLSLVHANFGDRAAAVRKGFVVVASRLVGANVILHLHAVELDRQYRNGNALLRCLIRIPFRMASSNIVLGEIWRRWLIDELGVKPDRVDVLFNGVPVEIGPPRNVAARSIPVRLLFLGNLLERKGVADLLNAVALLPTDLPAWHLTLAGGGDVEHFKAFAAELGLVGKVDFPGWVDQKGVRDHLKAADVMVLPSYEEGLPLVILEALGCGTPVLCTPVGAIPEALEQGKTALFCRPGDPANVAEALAMLISRPELRQKLSDEGRAAFAKKFSLSVFLTNLFDIYRRRYGIDIVPAVPELARESR